MALKPFRATANLPGELEEDFDKRWHELGYPSFSAYLTGLALYDLWSRRLHRLTVPLMKEPQYIRDKIIHEIKAMYNNPDPELKRPGGWFERELERLLKEAAEEKQKGDDKPEK